MSMLVTRRPKSTAITPTSLFSEPFRMLSDLNRFDPFGMNRWDPFTDVGLQPWSSTANFMPAFELKETPTSLIVKADLPGIQEKDIELNVVGNRLTISGKREEEKVQDDEVCHLIERTYGAFNRTINLPEDVDANKVSAKLKEGVLTVTVPKSPEMRPKKITVQAT